MPIPFLIAGAAALAGATAVETAAVGVAAAVLTSDKKKEPEAKTSREKISASDVPEDIRRQVEGSRRSHRTDVKYSPQQYYEMGMEYYYGRNGRPINRTTAEVFLRRAAGSGHEAAGRQMRTLFG